MKGWECEFSTIQRYSLGLLSKDTVLRFLGITTTIIADETY